MEIGSSRMKNQLYRTDRNRQTVSDSVDLQYSFLRSDKAVSSRRPSSDSQHRSSFVGRHRGIHWL